MKPIPVTQTATVVKVLPFVPLSTLEWHCPNMNPPLYEPVPGWKTPDGKAHHKVYGEEEP